MCAFTRLLLLCTPRKWALTALFVVLQLPCLSGELAADDNLCGIYSAIGAARALGEEVTVPFSSFLVEDYVSDRKGSSAPDLKRAVEFLGLRATILKNLSYASLFSSKDPLILHLTDATQVMRYNHWALFLGMQDNQVVIFDNGVVARINLASVLARWDGTAVAVFEGDSPRTNFSAVETRWFARRLLLIALITSVFLAIPLRPVASRFFLVFLPIALVCAVAAVATLSTFGLVRNWSVLEFMGRTTGLQTIETVSARQVYDQLNLSPAQRPVLVDARSFEAFSAGTLPGSINIPVDTSLASIVTTTAKISRDQQLIVFCSSEDCAYSDIVAAVLGEAGFSDVKVFTGGIKEWVGFLQEKGKRR